MSNAHIATYAAFSKNETIREKSSSGALFSCLAEYIISEGGIVYATAMDEDCKGASFVRIADLEGIERLRGSKYLQSKVGNSFKNIKLDLENGLKVLFVGTGCQVNGLKLFLRKEYETLYCVDIVCHGVPSAELWKKYAEYFECENRALLRSINFRCKSFKRKKRVAVSESQIYIAKNYDSYMKLFFKDYSLRPSCYNCPAKDNKLSDLTLGDFWGINEILPQMNDGKGVSLIIIRNEKGKALFSSIDSNIEKEEINYDKAIIYNPSEYMATKCPEQRDEFYEDMKNMDFPDFLNKYLSPLKKEDKEREKEDRKYYLKQDIKKLILKTPLKNILHIEPILNTESDYGMLFTICKKGREGK